MAAVYFYIKDKLNITIIFFVLAFLTREDSIMVFIPLIIWDYQTNRSIRRIGLLGCSLIPFFLWQFFVVHKLGAVPTATSATVLSPIPFSGIAGHIKMVKFSDAVQLSKSLSTIAVFVYFMATLVITVTALKRTRHLFYYVVIAYCVLSVFTVPSQWNNFNGLLRMFYGFFPFLVLAYGVERDTFLKYSVYFVPFLFFLTVVRIIFVSPAYPFKVW